MSNKSAQLKKLLVLGIFVILLLLATYFLYNLLVKPSPYYPQKEMMP